MERKLIDFFLNKTKRIRIKYNKKLFVFIVCLLISSSFWLLNALGKNYITTISFPVKFKNMPTDKALVSELPNVLDVKVDGYGFTLMEYKLGFLIPSIEIDIDQLPINRVLKEHSSIWYLLTSSAMKSISNQIGTELKILEVAPDTISFYFEKVKKRKLKIVADAKITLSKQLVLKGTVRLKPDSVWVTGPHSIMDTLRNVKTNPISLLNLDQSKNIELFINPISNLNFSNSQLTLIVEVEQFTEGTVKVPITVINAPHNSVFRTFPSYITVTFVSGLSTFNKVKPELFYAVADFNTIKALVENKLKVNLLRTPEFVKINGFSPTNVEFLIEK